MFNMQKSQVKKKGSQLPQDLLLQELRILDIQPRMNEWFMDIGDEQVSSHSPQECKEHIKAALNELKEHLWQNWIDLGHLAVVIAENGAGNNGGLDNILFLNAVKKSYLFSRDFSDLDEITDDIQALFHIDAAEVHEKLIAKFNRKYIEVRLLHQLVMREIYRSKVLSRYMKVHKMAQISGPWANLDLPMAERVWGWEEDEEYFDMRGRSKRNQTRYNPEYDAQGFFYIWQDLTRGPYDFADLKTDSPYKSRHSITIP